MINLDQVRTLEWKVKQAVQLIGQLKKENETLRGRLSDTEVRLGELETLLESFKAAQSEMETGIRSALEELDHLDQPSVETRTTGEIVEESVSADEPVLEDSEVAVEAPSESFEVPVSLQSPESAPESDTSFEKEFAALVEAEERGAEFDDVMAPESVELAEETPARDDESHDKDTADQQPGLGIF